MAVPPDDLRRHRHVRDHKVIASAGNQTVRLIRSLGRRKGRDASGLFIVEGERGVSDALEAGIEPYAIVLRDGYVAGPAVLGTAPAAGDDRVRVLDAALFDSVSDTVHPQGILAVLPIPVTPALPALATLIVLLDGIRDPGNMGTLLRSSAAAGADAVIIGEGSVDAWNPKVVRAAMGAHFRVPVLPAESIEAGRLETVAIRAIAEAGAELDYDRADWSEPVLLIVGSEADGSGDASRAMANRAVSIPMAAGVESLNAAVAGSVILFEIARQRRSGSRRAKK